MNELDDYLSDDDVTCPRCDGWGHIDCHCGGDLCVCDNYGEVPCPLCHGDGQVSEERYEKYQSAQRQWWAAYQAAVNARQRRFDQAAPWKLRGGPKPATTPKRAKVKAARKQRQRNERA